MGKAKLAPTHGQTIPRLELCAAVLAIEITENIRDQLDIPPNNFQFFTDSKVVLGYISNESRRFYIYVANHVRRLWLFSQPPQWHFVKTECDPADVATRSIDAAQLKDSVWICGPMKAFNMTAESGFDLVNPDEDAEIRPEPEGDQQQARRQRLLSQIGSLNFHHGTDLCERLLLSRIGTVENIRMEIQIIHLMILIN